MHLSRQHILRKCLSLIQFKKLNVNVNVVNVLRIYCLSLIQYALRGMSWESFNTPQQASSWARHSAFHRAICAHALRWLQCTPASQPAPEHGTPHSTGAYISPAPPPKAFHAQTWYSVRLSNEVPCHSKGKSIAISWGSSF